MTKNHALAAAYSSTFGNSFHSCIEDIRVDAVTIYTATEIADQCVKQTWEALIDVRATKHRHLPITKIYLLQ